MTEVQEDCLTCRRETVNFLRISDETTAGDIGTIITSHFWFQAGQYEDRVLCTGCWEKIEDFHKFYCEVKEVWGQEIGSNNAVIKTERVFDEDGHQQELFACELVKVEITKNENPEKGNDENTWGSEEENSIAVKDKVYEESETTDDSEEDSTIPIAKRRRCSKRKLTAPKDGKPIRKKRKPSAKRLKQKNDESLFQCEDCDPIRTFRDKDGLHLHRMVCHSEEAEKTFQCDQCEKAFAYDWQLSGHKNWHQTQLLNIRCEICNKYFHSTRTLNSHIQANHSENVTSTLGSTEDTVTKHQLESPENSSQPLPSERLKTPEEHAKQDELIRKFCSLICEKCGFAGEHYYHLEKHYKSEHNVRGYALCCGRKFYRKRLLFDHCQYHVNPDTFHCELCKKSFPDGDSLEKHNEWKHIPDSEKKFKCEICDGAFYKDYLLKNHMKYHLSKEQKIYSCPDCDKSFGAPSYLKTHQQAAHGAASSWVCDICAKGFPHKTMLESHRLSHTKEGAASLKRQCEHCKRWLKNDSSYRRHLIRCLTDGRPVACDLCGKEVANQPALASHKRLYHTEQPVYSCSFCGKQFKRAIRHREHEANHRGDVLYSCEFCPYSCNSNSNMYTHKKAAHQELWAAKVAEKFYKR